MQKRIPYFQDRKEIADKRKGNRGGSRTIINDYRRASRGQERLRSRRSDRSINKSEIRLNRISGSYNIGGLPISATWVLGQNSVDRLKSNPFGLTQNTLFAEHTKFIAFEELSNIYIKHWGHRYVSDSIMSYFYPIRATVK